MRSNLAHSQQIETITFTRYGADKQLPLGTDFYLTGLLDGLVGGLDGAEVSEVHFVFVRRVWPMLGLFSPGADSCVELQPELSSLPVEGIPSWDTLFQEETIYVPDAWKRSPKDSAFKVLVQGGPFFRKGASYCLFHYVKSRSTRSHEVDFKKHLVVYGSEAWKCRGTCEAMHGTCDGKSASDEAKKNLAMCQQNAAASMVASVEQDFGSDSKVKDAWEAIRTRLADAITKLTGQPGLVQNWLADWSLSWNRRREPDATMFSTAGDALGRILAELLARAGEISRSEGKYILSDGAQITHIGLASDYSTFLVQIAPSDTEGQLPSKPPGRRKLSVDARKVFFPGARVSLHEFWEFTSGHLIINDRPIAIAELWTQGLDEAMARPTSASIDKGRIDFVHKLHDAVRDMRGLLQHAREAEADSSHTGVLLQSTKQFLGRDLTGYIDQLLVLQTWLNEYRDAAMTWNGAPQIIRTVTEEKWADLGEVGLLARASLDQKRWVTTYFTPVVGRTYINDSSASFWEWYTGVQIYGWANAIDEPMWINGWADLRRILALELAIVPQSQGHGPGKRFLGFAGKGSPPLLIGLVIQPLPYTTLSGGLVWQQERTSRIVDEATQSGRAWYFALSVQANLPDLIRNWVTGKGTNANFESVQK